MSLRTTHLRKLLKILYSEPNRRVSAIRSDIREDIAREAGTSEGGGDFYGPFWKDAKDHVFGVADLQDTTRARIASNAARANLYPRLQDGFLMWWNERRRWTNEPFRQAQALKTRFQFPGLDAVVKIDNILSVRDGVDEDHFIYPYFSPEPSLSEESGRLGLWLLGAALPSVDLGQIRVLDVMRGRTFSSDREALHGDEEAVFRDRYRVLLQQWDQIRRDY